MNMHKNARLTPHAPFPREHDRPAARRRDAGPNMAAYYASKSYVGSFTAVLLAETFGTGVNRTTIFDWQNDRRRHYGYFPI
jgi:hypothetical protein